MPNVTYSASGSDGGSAPVDPKTYSAGAFVTVLGNSGTLAKAAATFAYWNSAQDGSGTTYIPGTLFTLATNLTLYPQWFITTGLLQDPNGREGVTPYYAFTYDSAFQTTTLNPNGVEPARTNSVIEFCGDDFNLMSAWFPGVSLSPLIQLPMPVKVSNLNGGAGTGGIFPDIGITLKAASGSEALLRYLMVSEVTECFMEAQHQGWADPDNSNEGSAGEGLSRFLAQQFLVAKGFGTTEPGYQISAQWLNSSLPVTTTGSTQQVGLINYGARADFVNKIQETDHGIDPATGCAMLFLYYLHTQLGFGVNEIIAAASLPFAGSILAYVYKQLSRDSGDPFPAFAQLLNDVYPPNQISTIAGPNPDDPFPILLFKTHKAPSALSPSPGATQLYAVGTDGHVWTDLYPVANRPGQWSRWLLLGVNVFPAQATVTALSTGQGATNLYVSGLDDKVWSNSLTSAGVSGQWNGWSPIGANVFPAAAPITALSLLPGSTNLYVVGLDGQVWSNFFPQSALAHQWNGWFPLGPNVFAPGSTVTALSTRPGGTSLYVLGLDRQVWSSFFPSPTVPGQWSGWFPLGPNVFPAGTTITAISTGANATSLYVVGLDGQVWTNFFPSATHPGQWNGWFPLGPNVFPVGAPICALSLAEGATSLYVIGLDGRVWTNFFPGADHPNQWNGWLSIGPNVFPKGTSVTAISTEQGGTSLYVTGLDGQVWSSYFPEMVLGAQLWSGWFPLT